MGRTCWWDLSNRKENSTFNQDHQFIPKWYTRMWWVLVTFREIIFHFQVNGQPELWLVESAFRWHFMSLYARSWKWFLLLFRTVQPYSFWERNGELRAKPGVFQCSSYPNRRLFCSSPKVLKEMVESLQDVQGISRVLYDLTAKPPGTTEWE